METDIDLEVEKMGNISIIQASGDLDTFTCAKLREAICDLIENGCSRIVINIADVNYIDSSGLGTLVGGLRRVAEKNGGLAIAGANPQVQKVFTITGLCKVFKLFDDNKQAANSLKS